MPVARFFLNYPSIFAKYLQVDAFNVCTVSWDWTVDRRENGVERPVATTNGVRDGDSGNGPIHARAAAGHGPTEHAAVAELLPAVCPVAGTVWTAGEQN